VTAGASSPTGIRRVLPILDWAATYDRRWLRGDLIAGVAVAALIIPKNLGYAGIAGIPLQNGLYAAAAGAIVYAVLGTSRQISTGPSSSLAAVAASAVLAAGMVGEDAAALVATITVVSGVLFLVLAVLRMGWIASFLSRAVVTGFLFGAAIDVVVGELPKITGTEASGSNSLAELWSWLGTVGDAHVATAAVGIVALIVAFGVRAVTRTIPSALVLLVGGLIASWLLDLGERGVALVGDIPSGLPAVVLPSEGMLVDEFPVIAAAAVALVLIGFSQTAGDARAFAARHGYRVDVDQESVAQGAANIGAGLLQGMPVSTSLSASSLNDRSGARSGLASLATGLIVLLALVFLAPLFSDLPIPVLAALIIEAVTMGMMDVPEMRRLWRVQPFDFWIAMTAIIATLLFGVLAGVLFGIVLSLLWLVSVATRPRIPQLAREPGSRVLRELDAYEGLEPTPGAAILRLDGGLFFATADALGDRMREVSTAPGRVATIVLDCGGIGFIDSQGAAKLDEIAASARAAGITLRLARVKPQVRVILERDGFVERLGPDRIHGNVEEAFIADAARTSTDARPGSEDEGRSPRG
jgi:SulP family sulfate permease